MSGLYSLRRRIKKELVDSGVWTEGEVLIKRRTDIWNDVAVATAASDTGQCIVVGTAKGRRENPARKRGGKLLNIKVTIALTLIELPDTSLDQPPPYYPDEDDRWEASVLLLQGSPLGRSPEHYSLEFEDFEEVPDKDYVMRQFVFETTLMIKPAAG